MRFKKTKKLRMGVVFMGFILSLSACSGKGDSQKVHEKVADVELGEETTEDEETSESSELSAQTEDASVQIEDTSETIQFQLGASGLAIDVPRSYKNGEVTLDELESNQIAYYYSPYSEMDFDVYQFPKPDEEKNLKEYTYIAAEDFDGNDVHYRKINGINVGSYKSREIYDDVEYDVLVVLIEEGGEYVEIVFWLDGDNAETEAMNILSTLSEVKTYELQLGESQFWMTVPAGYKPGEIKDEDIADDQVGYYYSDSSPLDFDVYEFKKDGYTLEKYAIEEAKLYEAERVDYRTVNGIEMAFYYSYEESEGQKYNVANYLFEDGDEFIEVAFWLDGEIAVKQTDRILSTLKRKDK